MMSEYDSLPIMGEVLTRDAGGFSVPQVAVNQGDVAPFAGAAVIQTSNRSVTAQRVAVARSLPAIMREIGEYCAQFGDTYVYSWEVNNRQTGTKDLIEGGTIKMAMMLTQVFGNCSVDMDISETPTHLVFKAWFTDYEKGTQIARLFQQRKKQNTGMRDVDRQADIIFQIGQSKASRNVVLNALSSFATFALEESKRGMLRKFESPEARDRAYEFIDATLEKHGVAKARLEALVGRTEKNWTVRDLAKAYMRCRGVAEGLVAAEEAFPTEEAAEEMRDEQEAEKKETQSRATRTPKKSAKAAEEAPKADEQAGATTVAPETGKPAEAAPQFKETMVEKIKAAYFEADDFETIQALRADVAKNGYSSAPGVTKAYDDAMARVKKANAARAKGPGTDTASDAREGTAEAAHATVASTGDDEPDNEQEERDLLAGRVVAMFDGLDVDAEIGEALRKAAHYADQLDEAGDARFKEAVKAAYERAELAKRATESARLAAEAEAKRETTKPAPLASKAPPTMFSDDD